MTCRALGGTGRGWLNSDGRTGAWTGTVPDRLTPLDEAAIHLAGGAAQRLLVGRDGPSSDDTSKARQALRGTAVSQSKAQARAEVLVRRHRARIVSTAVRLHKTGRT